MCIQEDRKGGTLVFVTVLFFVILALGPLFVLVLGIRIIKLLQRIIPATGKITELEVRVKLLEQYRDREADHA